MWPHGAGGLDKGIDGIRKGKGKEGKKWNDSLKEEIKHKDGFK